LQHEYGASCRFQPLNYAKACWITSGDKRKLDEFIRAKSRHIMYDKDENPVFLAESQWLLNSAMENFPDVEFHFTSEFKTDALYNRTTQQAI
jgi:peptide chain release factor 3